MTAEENLERLGIVLPKAPAAVANYVGWVRTGTLLITSGQLPWEGPVMKYTAPIGRRTEHAGGLPSGAVGDHQRHRSTERCGW